MDLTTFIVYDNAGQIFGRYDHYRTARRQLIGPDGMPFDGREGWRIVEVRR